MNVLILLKILVFIWWKFRSREHGIFDTAVYLRLLQSLSGYHVHILVLLVSQLLHVPVNT